jgi:hypothetical protein
MGRMSLSIANGHIDVGAGEIQLNINGQKEKFAFKPKVEQCSLVKEVHRKKNSRKRQRNHCFPTLKPSFVHRKYADSGGVEDSRGGEANQAS